MKIIYKTVKPMNVRSRGKILVLNSFKYKYLPILILPSV